MARLPARPGRGAGAGSHLEAGLIDRVEIRVQDYRDVEDGPFDAVSSIGMSKHVGSAEFGRYAIRLRNLLRPGGRLLNHATSWNAGRTPPDPDSFIPRYVFPDGEMLSLSEMVGALETAGLEVLDVEALRLHCALTLRAWVRNLDDHWDEAVQAAPPGTYPAELNGTIVTTPGVRASAGGPKGLGGKPFPCRREPCSPQLLPGKAGFHAAAPGVPVLEGARGVR
ncbi:hypothetical protein IWX65_002817 [Arthrobacter sp. CAN_A214]